MSNSGEPDVTRLVRDLTRELQTLKRELDDDGRGQLSTRRQLSQFTSEVAIPSVILILETNIRALKLLRRTLRLAEGREPETSRSRAAEEVRGRAEQLGTEALSRLDETLATVQSSLADEGADEDVRRLLDEARQLQGQISKQLDGQERDSEQTEPSTTEDGDPVAIDVDTELQTLKDNLEDDPDGTDDQPEDGPDDSPPEDGAGSP
jgi:hypothetical protein